MSWQAENDMLMREEAHEAKVGFIITRGRDAHPHGGNKQRAAKLDPNFIEHPVIARGIEQFRETAHCGGAAALALFSMPTLDVSYAWFKSGYPLPLHSHDADCYYLVIAGTMKVGTELLEKGDGVMIPACAPYTVTPGAEGVEFIEMRTSPDYDSHFGAKSPSYWDRVAETRLARKEEWAQEKPPYGLLEQVK